MAKWSKMKKIYFKTFGCRTNIYDTELLKSYVKDYEIVNDELLADIIIINSCTVTNGADSGLRHYINQVKSHNKQTKFILTGCGAVSRGKELLDKSEIFGVFGAGQKSKINEFLKEEKSFYDIGELNFKDKKIISNYQNHTKAFVKVQEGCNFACSYCIIPSVRGKSRSLDQNDIINQVKILAQNGYNEIVITGTNIGSYGEDIGLSFGGLLAKLGCISGIKRIRLGSIEPVQVDDAFLEILDEPWLERHLHLALQHTSQKMLTLMRRRNKLKKDLELFEFLNDKGFALGTDFIVGHPGESDDVWMEALENFKKFNLTHLHAFIYSKRDGTHSVELSKRLGDISGDISKVRLNEIKSIVSQNNYEFRKSHANLPLEVLVEQKKGEFYEGYDQFFNKVLIKTDKDIAKSWLVLDEYEVDFENTKAKI